MPTTKPQLIVALDFPDAASALTLARTLAPQRPWMKVGLEMLMSVGPQIVRELRDLGLPVFLDGKFHDIPNTVAGAVRGATVTGANIINVHASGGVRMMRAAREAAEDTARATGVARPLVIAVTVLTSIAPEELRDEIGCARAPEEQVVALALRAKEAGLDGVVASVLETRAIKAACGPEFVVITPGIRPASGTADDQRRVATPRVAIDAGSDYLVVGRPITQAADPAAACAAILAEMRG
ncbi:MAG TPA: orotidine-5'-phosphate decarboxylase [Armatimonadota bacterium]|jgi:orotidine-5'-phosphate decarboxylase